MKRWILVLLLGLALLVIVAPGIIGMITESSLEDSIEIAAVETPEITIRTERFERGWFSSEGRHRIELSDRQRFPQLARFVDDAGYANMPALILDSKIAHGILPDSTKPGDQRSFAPGMAALATTVQLDPGNGELIDLPGVITSHIGMDGQTAAEVLIAEGDWSDDGVAIEWDGVDLDVVLTSDGRLLQSEGAIEAMSFSAEGITVAVGHTAITVDRVPTDYDLMVGSFELINAGATSTGEFGAVVGYDAFELQADTEMDDGALSGSTRVLLQDVSVPIMGSMSIELAADFAGIDAAAFVPLFNELAAQLEAGGGAQAIYPGMDAELQQLLSAGLDIRVNRFNLELPQGKLETDFSMSLPKKKAGAAFSWPGIILDLEASLKVRIPVVLFNFAAEMDDSLAFAVGMGYLIPDGDDYVMEIELANGTAKINGAPFAVPLPTM